MTNINCLLDEHLKNINYEEINSDNNSRNLFSGFRHYYVEFLQQFEEKSVVLFFYICGLLITSCWNALFFKKMTNAMPNYGWFLSQFVCFLFVPIFGIIVLISIIQSNFTQNLFEFPLYKYCIMGLLDSSLCLMSIIGGAFTSGPNQLVLSQLVVPLTLALSVLLLGQKYHELQYFASFVIILGVIVSQLDHFLGSKYLLGELQAKQNLLLFNIIFACGALPNAFSQIYKEIAFRHCEIDVNLMQFWVAVFQLILGILMVPINTLSLLGPQKIQFSNIPMMIRNGFRCLFLGQNSIVTNCGENISQSPCDDCAGAWIPVTLYIFFNVLYNVFTLTVIKYGSASLSFIISTLRLPLTTMCFYSSFIMGVDAVNPKIEDFCSLFCIISGLIAYRVGNNFCEMELIDENNDFWDSEGQQTLSTMEVLSPIIEKKIILRSSYVTVSQNSDNT